jgi:hypothetical protein
MKKLLPVMAAVLLTMAVYGQAPGGGFPGSNFPGGRTIPNSGARTGSDAIIKSDMALMAMDGSIPMRFANALDGQAIPGAQVAVNGVGIYTTDYRGIALLPRLSDGNYRLVFNKEGFITTPMDFQVKVGAVVFNWFSVSPGLEGRAYRFVLDWGERPADLDVHLVKRGDYHISYVEMRVSADGTVRLDRDDRDGYGPETITVNRAENQAVYDFYVFDFTDHAAPNSDNLSKSGAVVRVYSEDRLVYTFTVPSGPGIRWNVFTIQENQIRTVNTLTR